ncbi:hypothetical protein Tco_1220032 [Tanacetum coccineum]
MEPDTGPQKTEPETRHWTTENGNPRKRNPDLKDDSDDDAEAEGRRKGKMVVSDFLSGISKIEAENMRERGLSFLNKQLKSKPTEDNGWSDLFGSSEAMFRNGIEMDNSETSFGIHPFYIEKGGNHIEAKGFKFLASTTCRNSMRVLRAMYLKKRGVHVDELIEEDHLFICRSLHPSLPDCLLKKLIAFNKHLYEDTMPILDAHLQIAPDANKPNSSPIEDADLIMASTMTTRNASRRTATTRGGRTGEQASRRGGRTREQTDKESGQTGGQDGQGSQGSGRGG